jgi:hypothetical protein
MIRPKNSRLLAMLAVFTVLQISPARALAAGLTLEQGSSLSLGTAQLNLGCGDLNLEGELNLDSGGVGRIGSVAATAGSVANGDAGRIDFGGDWSIGGVFNAGTSHVALQDECGNGASNVSGDNSFYDLAIVTSTGKNVVLEADKHQSILHDLVLTGTEGNLLKLRSSIPGVAGILILSESGSQIIDYVDVQDSWAMKPGQHLALGWPQEFNSLDSGNNTRWFYNFEFSEPVPSLSYLGGLLFIVLILAGATSAYKRKFSRFMNCEPAA